MRFSIINEEAEVNEPPERTRDALALDQDKVGVVGHRNLGDTIFGKIADADVFVGDVTLVAGLKVPPTPDNPDGVKKLINSNVAIDVRLCGRQAHRRCDVADHELALWTADEAAVRPGIQDCPMPLHLGTDASKDEIARERKALTRELVEVLKLHVGRIVPPAPPPEPFKPMEATTSPAFFWKPREVVATLGELHPFHPKEDDVIKYTYNELRSVYLRLMPIAAIPPFDITRILNVVYRQRLVVMTQTMGHVPAKRNFYGAIAISPSGNATTPVGLSQIFKSGEIWGVSREFVSERLGYPFVPMISLERNLAKGLRNYIEVARDELGIPPPYQIEIGVTGIQGVSLSLPDLNAFAKQTSDPVFDEQLIHCATLTDVSPAAQNAVIQEFLRRLYDLAGVTYQVAAAST